VPVTVSKEVKTTKGIGFFFFQKSVYRIGSSGFLDILLLRLRGISKNFVLQVQCLSRFWEEQQDLHGVARRGTWLRELQWFKELRWFRELKLLQGSLR
jgi:hypothetical protein